MGASADVDLRLEIGGDGDGGVVEKTKGAAAGATEVAGGEPLCSTIFLRDLQNVRLRRSWGRRWEIP
jgi:hypothetical protein